MNQPAQDREAVPFEISHLAMMELYSPSRDQSVAFFEKLLGMYVVERQADATYLRAYEDPYRYSLKITDSKSNGGGVTTFRTQSMQALKRRAEVLEQAGLGDGWIESDFGHGQAYLFHSPDGHPMKLIWDVEYAQVAEEDRTSLRNRPSRRPAHGVPVRRIDHVNYMCSDVTAMKNMMVDQLSFRLSERVLLNEEGGELAAWTRTSQLAHDVAFMLDASGSRGRLHHVAFWYGIPQHLMDVAELCVQEGIKVEAGPGKHGISQGLFLYVIEPGGNRIELFGDSGYLIFDPTWEPVTWKPEQTAEGIMWIGAELPQDFFVYGTPVIEAAQETETDTERKSDPTGSIPA